MAVLDFAHPRFLLDPEYHVGLMASTVLPEHYRLAYARCVTNVPPLENKIKDSKIEICILCEREYRPFAPLDNFVGERSDNLSREYDDCNAPERV